MEERVKKTVTAQMDVGIRVNASLAKGMGVPAPAPASAHEPDTIGAHITEYRRERQAEARASRKRPAACDPEISDDELDWRSANPVDLEALSYREQSERRVSQLGLLLVSDEATSEALPAWLTNATGKLRLRARVICYWPGNGSSQRAVVRMLRRLGFHVEFEVVSTSLRAQIGLSCGFVAARVMHLLRAAGDGWFEYDAIALNTDATSHDTLLDADAALGFFRRAPVDNSSGEPRSRFVSNTQLLRALQHWWEPMQTAVTEAPGPPCARCGKNLHRSADCPFYPGPRACTCTDWCSAGTMDETAAVIAEALHQVATGAAPRAQIFRVSNDCYTGPHANGNHWFSVICDIRCMPCPAPRPCACV